MKCKLDILTAVAFLLTGPFYTQTSEIIVHMFIRN